MSYRATIICDGCDREADAPKGGGFPDGWTELNSKPSLRGDDPQDQRKRRHWCIACMDRAVFEIEKIKKEKNKRRLHVEATG
jgi:hypothetical protein